MMKLNRSVFCFLLLVFIAVAPSAEAENYPNKPIELILPAAPGGTTDTAVRLMAGKWQEFLGQPVVVVNVPGAGGAIGANRVARAKPDGYTLLGAFDSLLVALPFVQSNVEYDLDSFTYINGFGLGAIYLVARADAPFKTVSEAIETIRGAQQNKFSYASYGIGVITHFTAERLWDMNGVKLNYIPYKSSPESVLAMLGGHVDFAVTAGTGGAANHPQARILAIASENRREDTPDVPTLKELGYPVSLDFISAVLAPRGLSKHVEEKLVSAIQSANAKYGDLFKEQLLGKADLIYVNMTGQEVHDTWRERQAWFKELAPKMELPK